MVSLVGLIPIGNTILFMFQLVWITFYNKVFFFKMTTLHEKTILLIHTLHVLHVHIYGGFHTV